MDKGSVASLVPTAQASAETAAKRTPELSIVVPQPVAAEAATLVADLQRVLAGHDFEIVFVDPQVETLAAFNTLIEADRRVRVLRQVGGRGLAAAEFAGMLASHSEYIAVIEAGEAPAAKIVAMLARLRESDVDIVVTSEADTAARSPIRRWSVAVLRLVLRVQVSDPKGGTFMIRRSAFERFVPKLSAQGFRILIDLLFTARGRLRLAEVDQRPVAAPRLGVSDIDLMIELVGLTISKLSNDAISIRFILFCMVGSSGVGIHMTLLESGLALFGLPFPAAQTLATVGAMIWNFSLNNAVTYRDQQLRGTAFFTGLIRFMIICAVGAISNVGIASWIYGLGSEWWLAGLGGLVIGAVWNYAVSAVFVWRQR